MKTSGISFVPIALIAFGVVAVLVDLYWWPRRWLLSTEGELFLVGVFHEVVRPAFFLAALVALLVRRRRRKGTKSEAGRTDGAWETGASTMKAGFVLLSIAAGIIGSAWLLGEERFVLLNHSLGGVLGMLCILFVGSGTLGGITLLLMGAMQQAFSGKSGGE